MLTRVGLARHAGPAVLVGLVLALALQWLVVMPAGQDAASYLGQLAGAEAVLLMSVAVVLVTTLPWVETWFDGIDRAAIWHRRAAITGMVLLVPHIAFSSGGGPFWAGPAGVVSVVGLTTLVVWAILPRWRSVVPAALHPVITAVHEWAPLRVLSRWVGDYEVWRALHRLTGLFLAVGFVHGLGDASVFGSAQLRWTYVGIGAVGLAFYAYRELLARRGHGLRDYQVTRVEPVGADLTEIALRPLGRPLEHRPGQFAMLHLESKAGWARHPFTLASGPHEAEVRVTVKALGDWTAAIGEAVRPGMPAVLSGPHGRFTHTKGTAAQQLWIAGGVGITPFLSWMRSLSEHPPAGPVDLFWSVATEEDAPYAAELGGLADEHPQVTFHLVRTRADGRLTAAGALQTADADPRAVSVFLCGPTAMVRGLTADLQAAGVPRRAVFREHFDWR